MAPHRFASLFLARLLEFYRSRASVELDTSDYSRLRMQVYAVPLFALGWWAIIALAFVSNFDDALIHAVNIFGATVSTISILLLYFLRSYRISATVFLIGMYVSLIGNIALTASIFAPAMMLLPFLPVIANLLLGRRSGVTMTVLVIAAVIVLGFLSYLDVLYVSSVS